MFSNYALPELCGNVTRKYGMEYSASQPVGEVNCGNEDESNHCCIGGEGNGGVIYPASHYGRDALVGNAIILRPSGSRRKEVRRAPCNLSSLLIAKKPVDLTPEID